MSVETKIIFLNGEDLLLEELMSLDSKHVNIDLTSDAWKKIEDARKVVSDLLQSDKIVYGINTGFGALADVKISKEDVARLQVNLIRSHSAGVGEPLKLGQIRRLLALRINVLAKGRSGIRRETVERAIAACNSWCLPYIPCKGTVGASGDLAPLSHLALGLMGEGKMWDVKNGKWEDADRVLEANGLSPIELKAKEGLAMINGTTLICTLGVEAVTRAENAVVCANIAGAMTLEAQKGTVVAFNELIHKARPHVGQSWAAKMFRALLHSETSHSEIAHSHHNCGRVQDSYTLRCMPQVHGISYDTIQFVRGLLSIEINSATDNPMVFTETNTLISGGNFHGEYPAKALDYLAIGVHELASISERRIERLVNPSLSGLPPFLIPDCGLNSGFMIAHCTAAALVSENKGLCHPASTDSISTSAAKEDHVSMGGWAARKALMVVENVETVLAIEILAACQALDFMKPLLSTKPIEAVRNLVRSKVPFMKEDRIIYKDIEAVKELLVTGQILKAASPYIM